MLSSNEERSGFVISLTRDVAFKADPSSILARELPVGNNISFAPAAVTTKYVSVPSVLVAMDLALMAFRSETDIVMVIVRPLVVERSPPVPNVWLAPAVAVAAP